MTKQNERRLRRLEGQQRPAPYPEIDYNLSESEIVAARDAGRAALKGDAAAEAELYRLLALADARRPSGSPPLIDKKN